MTDGMTVKKVSKKLSRAGSFRFCHLCVNKMVSLLAGLLLISPRLELFEKYQSLTTAKRWNFLELNMMNFSHVEDEWKPTPSQFSLYRESIDPLIWYLQQPNSQGKYTKNILFLLQYLTTLPSANGYLYEIIPNGKYHQFSDTFLTLCARYGHLNLLNLFIDEYFTVDFNGVELNTKDSLLHILARNCADIQYQQTIRKLIKNTNIEITIKNKKNQLFTTIIKNNPNCTDFSKQLEQDEMNKYTLSLYHAIDKNHEPLTKLLLTKIIGINKRYPNDILVCVHLPPFC